MWKFTKFNFTKYCVFSITNNAQKIFTMVTICFSATRTRNSATTKDFGESPGLSSNLFV